METKNGDTVFSSTIMRILVFGIAIRAALSIFTYLYDSSFWALSAGNLMAGHGLYDVPGFYYPPVWGYLIAFLSAISKYVLRIDAFSSSPEELMQIVGASGYTVVPSAEYLLVIKATFWVMDIIAAFLIHRIIFDLTGDRKKAETGFIVWFLCPLTIVVSSVSCMFESVAIVFMLLTLYAVMKERYCLAGVLFTMSVLTKLFPIYMIFILLVYVLFRDGDPLGRGLKNAVRSILASGISALLLCLPPLLNGTGGSIFFAVSSRATAAESSGFVDYALFLKLQPLMIVIVLFMAILLYYYHKECPKEEFNERFVMLALLSIAAAMFVPAGPGQYYLFTIPIFAYCVAMKGSRQYLAFCLAMSLLLVSWLIINPASALYVYALNSETMDLSSFVDYYWDTGIVNYITKILSLIPLWLFLLKIIIDERLFEGGAYEER